MAKVGDDGPQDFQIPNLIPATTKSFKTTTCFSTLLCKIDGYHISLSCGAWSSNVNTLGTKNVNKWLVTADCQT